MTAPSLLFLDTGVLIRRLLNEPGASDIQMLLDAHPKAVFFSAISVVETLEELTARYRSGSLPQAAYQDACERFLAELRGSGFVVLDYKLEDAAVTLEMAERHGLEYNDALHFAIIRKHLDVFGKDAAQYVCCNDKLLQAARAEGFRAFRPGAP